MRNFIGHVDIRRIGAQASAQRKEWIDLMFVVGFAAAGAQKWMLKSAPACRGRPRWAKKSWLPVALLSKAKVL